MAKHEDLNVIGFITKKGEEIDRCSLPHPEQEQLAHVWNQTSMTAAGYRQVQKKNLHSTFGSNERGHLYG